MSLHLLTGRGNEVVKYARAIRDGKDRTSIFIEGLRLCEEAAQAGLHIKVVLSTETFQRNERSFRLLKRLEAICPRNFLLNERVFSSVSDTKAPQGIILLASRPAATALSYTGWTVTNALLVVIHRINNPSNAGSIVRTAEAAGGTGLISSEGTADLFSTRALRGSMGSAFRLPLSLGSNLSEVMNWCRRNDIQTVAADAQSSRNHTDLDWKKPSALLLGAEAAGLQTSDIDMTDATVRIPMRDPVESLNVGAACAVMLYEAVRQRTTGPASE